MNLVDTVRIACPYCGENVELVIDCSVISQVYIEDCEVCCKPINISANIDENGNISVLPRHDNEC